MENSSPKQFTTNENIFFLPVSLFLVWASMFMLAIKDINNDRGFLTIIGNILLTSFLFTLFLSKNKLYDFFITTIYLLLLSFVVFILIFSLGNFWLQSVIILIALGISMFLIIRRFILFPNNKLAFLVILAIPLPIAATINLPFYDNSFRHEFGFGFLIASYLSLLFITISALCRKNH